jgi:hypothetical protein
MIVVWSAHALDGERSSATQDKASMLRSATAPSAPTMPPLQLCHLADHTWLALTPIAAENFSRLICLSRLPGML